MLHVCLQEEGDPSLQMGEPQYNSGLHAIADLLEEMGKPISSFRNQGMPQPSGSIPHHALPLLIRRQLYDQAAQAAIVLGPLGEASLNPEQRIVYQRILAARAVPASQVRVV